MPAASVRAAFVLAVALLIAGAAQAAGPSSLRPVSARPQVGKASRYGPGLEGRTTASGAKLQPHSMTAASKTLPLGTKAQVTNLENGKSVLVTIIDRGPHARRRILDVSTAAASRLGMKKQGVATVKVTPVAAPPKKVR